MSFDLVNSKPAPISPAIGRGEFLRFKKSLRKISISSIQPHSIDQCVYRIEIPIVTCSGIASRPLPSTLEAAFQDTTEYAKLKNAGGFNRCA